MKKILALILILVCCFSLGACNKNNEKVVMIDSLYDENFSFDLIIQRNNEKIDKLHFVAISGNTFCYYFSENYPEKIERRAKVSIKEINQTALKVIYTYIKEGKWVFINGPLRSGRTYAAIAIVNHSFANEKYALIAFLNTSL